MTVSAKAYQVLSCLKLFLVIFTVLFLCTGIILLATGIYSQLALTHYYELSPLLNLSLIPPIFCGVGGFIIISGLFGFLAAIKNNRCLINIYCCLLSFVCILEIVTGIGAILFISNFKGSFEQGFNNAIQTTRATNNLSAMDKAQKELKCCGTTSYSDWYNSTWANLSLQCDGSLTTVPPSCCKPEEKVNDNSTASISSQECFCGDMSEEEKIYTKGCLEVLFGKNKETLYYLAGSAFGCALLQLICVIITICIFLKLRQLRKTRRY